MLNAHVFYERLKPAPLGPHSLPFPGRAPSHPDDEIDPQEVPHDKGEHKKHAQYQEPETDLYGLS